jgi:4-amino-4-deoxy-L-arabinose transferase-like glycosyltransferase
LGKNILKVFPLTDKPSGWQVLLLFSLLVVILRFFSFFPSVIDHDESTYLEMARQLLTGKVLYEDMIDIKPPGIFLILAGFQAVFGYSIFFIRLLVALWIGVTAFMIFKTGKLLFNDHNASLAAGIIYILFISTWSFYGISITPEIFFNLFTIVSLYLLVKNDSAWNYLFAGLLAGMGFVVKYFVLVDFAVFILFFLFLYKRENVQRRPVSKIILSLMMAGVGLILPFGLTNLYFYVTGHWDAFFNIIYLAPQRYPSPINPVKMSKFLLDFQLRFFPIFYFFYYSLFDKSLKSRRIANIKGLLLFWSLTSLFAVVISGNHYGHYTIQLMLPVSLMAGLFFHSERSLPSYLHWMTAKRIGLIVLVSMILLITAMKLEYVIRQDTPREIANYLRPRLKESDVLYTGNYHHILYYLLKKDSPTPYIHRTLLIDEGHIKTLNIDATVEFQKIINQRPLYIMTQKEYPQGMMKDHIINNYTVEKDFGNRVLLWRRVD